MRYSRTSLNRVKIFRRRLAERLVRLEHRARPARASRRPTFRPRRRWSAASCFALRGRRPVGLDVENLIESQARKQIAAALAAMDDVEMACPSSFKRRAIPAIVPMKVESIITHSSRSKTNSR